MQVIQVVGTDHIIHTDILRPLGQRLDDVTGEGCRSADKGRRAVDGFQVVSARKKIAQHHDIRKIRQLAHLFARQVDLVRHLQHAIGAI